MSATSPLNPLHERLLVSRAQRGDSEAFRFLVKAYDTRLRYFVRRFVFDEHRAADLLQEVWLDVFRGLSRLKSNTAFRCWIYQIAHDKAVSQTRRERREAEIIDAIVPEESVGSVEEFTRIEQAESVHRALQKLSDDHRAALTLRFLEDMPIGEIAQVLRVPEGTVKSRLYHAKESMRNVLREESLE